MRISDWSSDVCSSDLVEAADESVIFDRRDQEVAPILALGKAAVAPVTRGAASRDAAIGILADIGRAVGREEIGLAVHIGGHLAADTCLSYFSVGRGAGCRRHAPCF